MADDEKQIAEPDPSKPTSDWKTFLESAPPGVEYLISDLFEWGPLPRATVSTSYGQVLSNPQLLLYCDQPNCGRRMLFVCVTERVAKPAANQPTRNLFVSYVCRHCAVTKKTFSLLVGVAGSGDNVGVATKFGELPARAPRVPARVIALIGPDREMFLKGRRAEKDGLGIGAFAYYRRVVENQKGRLIREIAKAAKKLGASTADLELFDRASREAQFSTAIALIKDAIPETIKIDGHNPLTLLHSAPSQGLHAETDDECLRIAGDIRSVLVALSANLAMSLREQAGIKAALTRLMTRNAPSAQVSVNSSEEAEAEL